MRTAMPGVPTLFLCRMWLAVMWTTDRVISRSFDGDHAHGVDHEGGDLAAVDRDDVGVFKLLVVDVCHW